MAVSEHQGPHYRPQIVRLALEGHPQKGPLVQRNSHARITFQYTLPYYTIPYHILRKGPPICRSSPMARCLSTAEKFHVRHICMCVYIYIHIYMYIYIFISLSLYVHYSDSELYFHLKILTIVVYVGTWKPGLRPPPPSRPTGQFHEPTDFDFSQASTEDEQDQAWAHTALQKVGRKTLGAL